jgi:tripartite-type tricarboxylate transporter receptor subunit TctC
MSRNNNRLWLTRQVQDRVVSGSSYSAAASRCVFLLCYICIGMATCLAMADMAAAQTYPTRVIRLIVTQPPGGVGDTIGRLVASGLSRQLKQQVIVDNRAGGSGAVGALAAINSRADGYSIFLGSGSNVGIDPAYEKIDYNPRDLTAVAPLVTFPFVIAANPAFPPNNIRELIALAKSKPGKIDFAISGTGGAAHLATELLKAMAKVDMVPIPYKGAAAAVVDVVAGRVPFITCDVNTALPYLQNKQLKALAVTGAQRTDLLPDLPTVAESGLSGYEGGNWHGIFAPRKTPSDIVAILFKATDAVLKEGEFKKRIVPIAGSLLVMNRDDFERYIAEKTAKRTTLLKSIKFVIEH